MIIKQFSKDILRIDPEKEADKIASGIRDGLKRMKRRGLVLGLSGGIDSSVTTALAVKALGDRKARRRVGWKAWKQTSYTYERNYLQQIVENPEKKPFCF